MGKLPLIPIKDNRIVAFDNSNREWYGNYGYYNNFFQVPPSFVLPDKYECVSLNIPSLIPDPENKIRLKLVHTEVQALRLYCRHEMTEEKEANNEFLGGVGTEEDPFTNFWNATEFASCLSDQVCMWVQVIVSPDIPVNQWGKRSSPTGRHVIIGSLDGGPRFTSHVPIGVVGGFNDRGMLIAGANLEYDSNGHYDIYYADANYRKLVNVNIKTQDSVYAYNIISCNVESTRGVGCINIYGSKVKSPQLIAYTPWGPYDRHISECTINLDGSYNMNGNVNCGFMYNCDIIGPQNEDNRLSAVNVTLAAQKVTLTNCSLSGSSSGEGYAFEDIQINNGSIDVRCNNFTVKNVTVTAHGTSGGYFSGHNMVISGVNISFDGVDIYIPEGKSGIYSGVFVFGENIVANAFTVQGNITIHKTHSERGCYRVSALGFSSSSGAVRASANLNVAFSSAPSNYIVKKCDIRYDRGESIGGGPDLCVGCEIFQDGQILYGCEWEC